MTPQAPSPSTSLDVAKALLDAWNRHSPEDMAKLSSPDFELFYVGENGRAELALTGPEALRAEMGSMFERQPDIHSRMLDFIDGERFVAFREQVVGGATSIAVYEIEGMLVRRAWYYPAEATPGAASGSDST